MGSAGPLNADGNVEFTNSTSYFADAQILPQGAGWSIVCGFGFVFSLFTIIFSLIDTWLGRVLTAEEFSTAGRRIKVGLSAVDIIAHWAWVSDIVQAVDQTYRVGISGAFWYSAGAGIQIILFAVTAVEMKRRAPMAITFVELVRHRWGHTAGFVFLYFGLLNNIIVTCINLLGASESLAATTGISVYACLVLIPAGITVYTVTGGLRATITSSYVHTVGIFVFLCIFMVKVFVFSPIGSLSVMYQKLRFMAQVRPVEGNAGGEYLTFWSLGGLEFGVVNMIGSFGNIWLDQSFWQTATATRPKAVYNTYIFGGLLWLSIPLCISTSMGLSALAANLPISKGEADAGLVAVAAADYFMGKAGVWYLLVVVFMAATSSCSIQLMAMGTLLVNDVYQPYFRPELLELMKKNREVASDVRLGMLRVSVVIVSFFASLVSCLLHRFGVNLDSLFLIIGLMISSGFPPLVAMLLWSRVSSRAAVTAAGLGQICGITGWLVHAQIAYGRITMEAIQNNFPIFTGNVAAVISSSSILMIFAYLFPDSSGSFQRFQEPIAEYDDKGLDHLKLSNLPGYKWTRNVSILLALTIGVAWPLLTLPLRVFSKWYFVFFCILCLIWGFVSATVSTVLPIWESRQMMKKLLRQILECRGRIKKTLSRQPVGSREKADSETINLDDIKMTISSPTLDFVPRRSRKGSQNVEITESDSP